METAVVVALISLASSLAVAVWTAVWTSRQNEKARNLQIKLAEQQADAQRDIETLRDQLQRQATRETIEHARSSEAKAVLDRYRSPLLVAAWELGDRIDKIRHRGFFDPIRENNRLAEQAELTTLFRFAQYFGWREVLRSEVQLLRFESDVATKLVASLTGDIVSTLATAELDGGRAMLWAEQQRAIGELMMVREGATAARCIGYAEFFNNYDDRLKPWMGEFASSLQTLAASQSDRLRLLAWGLLGLVWQLDEEGVRSSMGWTERASAEFHESRVSPTAMKVEHRLRKSLAAAERRS